MTLPVQQIQTIDLLPENAQPFLRAMYQTEIISKLSQSQANEVVLSLITICLQEAGLKDAQDAKVKVFLTERLLQDLRGIKFKHLTVGELKIVLSEGVRGTYGQFMGINITTIHNWIKSFYEDERRKKSLIYYNKLLSMQIGKPQPTPEEMEKTLQAGCISAYEDFKKGEETKIPKVIYDYLWKYFNIEWSREERLQIKEQAKMNFKSELTRKKFNREITTAQYVNILNSGNSLDIEMKKVALKKYFEKLQSENKQLIFNM
jgi:hypothetical protein